MRLLSAALITSGALVSPNPVPAQPLRFQADSWITECETTFPPADCSLTAVLRDIENGGASGSFAVVIGLESVLVAVVGQPFPVRATLRVDKYPPARCVGPRYCLFTNIDSEKLISELAVGTLILVDVFTAKNTFRSSLSTKGYHAGIAKIRAASYR